MPRKSNNSSHTLITQGYARERHWEIIYHDLVDLYGPKTGLEGIGLWYTYKRFVQHTPGHLLLDKAWPSHRGFLSPLFRTGQTSLRNTRQKLKNAGLITITTGAALAARSQEEYDQQLLIWQEEGKPHGPVRRVTLAALAALGIQNPARSLLIEVHDPLTFHPFCDKFNLTYSPQVTSHDGNGLPMWNMAFDDYCGLIRGPNRLLAASRYIEDNLNVSPADRPYRPLVTEAQILSLLRCKDDDRETVTMRGRLLQRRAALAGQTAPGAIPTAVLTGLNRLGWVGDTSEVEAAFHENPQRVSELLNRCLQDADTARNPAAVFRQALRTTPPLPAGIEMEEISY